MIWERNVFGKVQAADFSKLGMVGGMIISGEWCVIHIIRLHCRQVVTSQLWYHLQQGLSEPEFYGDLVYEFKKIVGRADFSDQFKKLSFVTNVLDIT